MSVGIPSLALCIALYTFLSNNSKFREFGKKFWGTVMLQLIAIMFCAGALVTDFIISKSEEDSVFYNVSSKASSVLVLLFLFSYMASWIYMCEIFYTIYGSLYHLRKKRFIKYTRPVAWFYEKFIHKTFYEKNYRDRGVVNFDIFSESGVDSLKLKKMKKGGTLLLLYDDNVDYTKILTDYIKETISDGDTVDYTTTYRSPLDICRSFKDEELSTITKHLSIIDCFSPHYSFDDKVVKFSKQEFSQKGFKFFDAESFADVHTAANDSWYRFRKICKAEENQYRIPHRTIYDTLSSLIGFSSEELYFLFIRHVIASEKSYGVISLFIEPDSIKKEIRADLIRMSDVVIKYGTVGYEVIKT